MEEHDRTVERIRELIDAKKWADLKERIRDIPPQDIPRLFPAMEHSRQLLLFRLLPPEMAAEVFSYLDSRDKDALLTELTSEEAKRLLAELAPDDRTDLLTEMPPQAIQRLLNLLSAEDLREARDLLGYPKESVGRLMTPDYVAVRPHWSIEQCLRHIKAKGKDSETINIIYVTDDSWKLLDAIELRRFILADPDQAVSALMDHAVVSIQAREDREMAVALIQRYDLEALPVVDATGVLLGIATVDDIMDVAEKEATEDFQKTAAVEPLAMRYREVGMLQLYRKRIFWLVALLGVNIASAGVIAAYETTIASALTLAYFVPIMMGSGGNVGTQSATLIVRAVATGEIEPGLWLRTVAKEAGVGLFIAITIGALGFAIGFFKGGREFAFVVSSALVSIVLVTNMIGVVIPFVLKRLSLDPAVASSPLIASISDITCLMIYFAIASRLLELG